ncbi:TonB-dependent receptor domain-containing protein [Halopseudomonas maritima]|uniref:TonB-dependent receptor domain-containing protein n=1 Tax=Halopseudomonas maritima TaxID=2918528 RepID=UPI001EEC8FBB|nr:TonB-dependent receptor [Halopseudomonas maritima]UJJ32739.1 TonB-dependent receptor [Halopseudomonas maritima]
MDFKPNRLALVVSALSVLGVFSAQAQDQAAATASAEDVVELQPIHIEGKTDIDAQAQDEVYTENVTSVYQSREELQRFQTANPGDVFKGMNGVYSMDTRSSQAITPNIRGISGEGRVPLTIDGTEQSTNVWLHMFGAGNRNYVDPALFRSIEVEKGPSLSRGIRSGVGGAVNIRTIEPGDIIPDGDSWGIEANLRGSGNTSKPRFDASSMYGQDWRNVPGATVAGDGLTVHVPLPQARSRGDGELFNLDDHGQMVAIAGRHEFVDILLSRSERTTGNYYAGKQGADRYAGHDVWDDTSTDRYIPNLTKLYAAGSEVFNTASETDTTLFKNNWYLPHEQRLGLQFMRTDMLFGETTPGASVLAWGYLEAADRTNPDRDRSDDRLVYETPRSEQRLDNYKLSYDIKPVNSDWLNLEASLWRTELEGTRYQTGASPYAVDVDQATQQQLKMWSILTEMGYLPPGTPPPEHDGTIYSNGRQWTSHDRTGLDLSNQMQLTDTLQLTFGGSYQKEKLDDRVQQSLTTTNGLTPDGSQLNAATDLLGPRSGEREEYSAMFNFAWQPRPWLTLTAGTRYLHYTGKDTGTAKRRRQQAAFYEAQRRQVGMELEWGDLLTPEEHEARQQAIAEGPEAVREFLNGRQLTFAQINGRRYAFWKNTAFLPIDDGKFDSSKNPFVNGEVDASKLYEVVDNALDQNGDPRENSVPLIMPINLYGTAVYETLNAGQAWEMPEEQSGDAFSPALSATARITPYGTAFLRFAQTTRFPSIQELTSSAIVDGAGTLGNLAVNGASKPERSTNWEVGYSHDLTQFFPGLALADARLSYYNTEIRDFIDRGYLYDVIQFDRKKTSGIELQSRFDSGRYFGSLGATYRLKQQLCDKDYASGMDPFYNRIPECMTGGFPGTYSGNSLQPEYSVDLGLGTRLFNDRLELGVRSVYHAGASNDDLDDLLASEAGPDDYQAHDAWFRGGLDTFLWRSVWLHDLYANLEVNRQLSLNLGVTNVTDEYYLDPMSKNLLPGPGRTLTAGLRVNF